MTKGYIEKIRNILKTDETSGLNDKLVVSKSSCNFEETPKS